MKDKQAAEQFQTSEPQAQAQLPKVRNYSSASSLGVLAADEHESDIRLTKFSTLPQEANHVIIIGNEDNQLSAQNDNNSRVIEADRTSVAAQKTSMADHSEKSIFCTAYGKTQGYINNNNNINNNNREEDDDQTKDLIDVIAACQLEQQMALFKHRQQATDEKEFQVVWRSLSFEVETSTYDRLMNLAFDGMNSLFRLGCLSSDMSHKKSCQVSNMSSTCELANDQQAPDELLPKLRAGNACRRTVFKNLNGYIKSGEISAILGPSGAGKTSLLNALCGGTLDNYRGSIQLVGGGDRRSRMQLSIIPQKDYLVENLTVRENLLYSSQLLNSDKNFNHEANISRVVKMLNLNNCLESSASNISGGEYKRVSIAQELLRQPDILILDEPTSGLDSLNCKKLIRSLKQLIEASKYGAMKPIAVVMTIHQPDIDIFNMFDHVYCMARQGRVVFDGRPSEAMSTLKSFSGFVPGAPNSPPELSNDAHVNPANLLIEIASGEMYGEEPIERLARRQRKQFEQMLGSFATFDDQSRLSPIELQSNKTFLEPNEPSIPWMANLDVSQLQSNLLLSQQQAQQHQVAINSKQQIGSAKLSMNHRSQMMKQPTTTTTSSSSATTTTSSSPSSSIGPPSPASTISSGAIVAAAAAAVAAANTTTATTTDFAEQSFGKSLRRDKRLRAKHDHRGKFWYHTALLARRAFVSTLRDPLMTMVVMLFHLFLPFVMWMVYPRQVGRINACPVIQRDLDIVSMASNKTLEKMGEMQSDMMATVECSTMLFITTYALSMCSLTVAALAFPLNMHILLKEVRNGWYDLKTFVLAKQIASFPFEIVFPCVSMALIYVMLDMPSSEYEWRLWSIALVMATIAMISNTHGLIIGTACMDSVQTSVFLSISSTLPQVLLSGFTSRIKWMPAMFRYMSWLSQYRYANELINMIRFGFDICPCDDETDEYLRSKKPSFGDIPENIKPMFLYYLSANEDANADQQSSRLQNATDTLSDIVNSTANALANNATKLLTATEKTKSIVGISHDLILNPSERKSLLAKFESNELDIFDQMAEVMTRSLSFGRPITSCKSVKSQLLQLTEGQTEDMFFKMVAYMIAVLIFFKIVLFFVVKYKVGSRI